MDWTEISIETAVADSEAVADICNMADVGGVYIEDYSDLEEGAWEIAHIDLIDEALINKDRTKAIVHCYISEENNAQESLQFITERLNATKIAYKCQSIGVNDADWADNWKNFFKVTEIGERLVICPSWETYDNKQSKTVLKIDPGAAFGTGTHATTSLCLGLLEKYVEKGSSVLDIGSGSGILSIASVLLGAERADGVDIDPTAVKVAKENAELNGVDKSVNYIVGDLADKISGKYNVVCANIVADIIIKLNANIKKYMEKDAVYITSGIIDIREKDVLESFEKCGLVIVDALRKENWCAFALKLKEEADA